ncbi:YdcH family protein [Ideonella sp.]|uniref:YdcH family protein n=1 Tax=Ideonella sp. TaxID=1929293 RepID=UPI0035AE8AE7
MPGNINWPAVSDAPANPDSLHSPHRRLIELRMEHADLDGLIDRAGTQAGADELSLRRLKKRRLALRDEIARLEAALEPPELA